MPPPDDPPCHPAIPLPVLLVAGSADPIVRWNGEVVTGGVVLQRRRSVPESFAFWVATNGCAAPREPVALPRRGAGDSPGVWLHEAPGCRGGVPTRLLEIRGAGHRLPGGEDIALFGLIGRTTQDLEASELLVAFLREVEAAAGRATR
jgi:polyhydroxybutyrate depolymerase